VTQAVCVNLAIDAIIRQYKHKKYATI